MEDDDGRADEDLVTINQEPARRDTLTVDPVPVAGSPSSSTAHEPPKRRISACARDASASQSTATSLPETPQREAVAPTREIQTMLDAHRVEPGQEGHRPRRRRRGLVRGSRYAQTWVLREDPPLKIAQLRPGVDADLLGEGPPRGLVGGEGVRLATRAVQAEHQLTAQALPQRVLMHERLQPLTSAE